MAPKARTGTDRSVGDTSSLVETQIDRCRASIKDGRRMRSVSSSFVRAKNLFRIPSMKNQSCAAVVRPFVAGGRDE